MRLTDKNAIVEALKAGRVVSLHVGAAARTDERAARIAALAREAAGKTLAKVKKAMGLNYFG